MAKHRWDYDETSLRAVCRKCFCIQFFKRVKMRDGRDGVREDGFLREGSRIVYDRRPDCKPLPPGMKRVA